MREHKLMEMYGTTPESFKRRVALAVKKTEAQPVKRKFAVRTALLAAMAMVLLMAAAYAAFSSQVTAFFGKLYGSDMQTWLEKGDVATANQSFTLQGVTFTLEEVVYRNNGLYGVGAIRPQEGSAAVLITEDYTPDAPYGYDIYGAGGISEEAPAGTPTIADVVREKGGKLMMARTLPDRIGVDGGELLSPGTIGYTLVPQRDGSIRFSFELSDAYAVEAGEIYTIQMWVSVYEMTADGDIKADARHSGTWTVEIRPTPINSMQ